MPISDNEKIENLLRTAIMASDEEREKSENLSIGYEPLTQIWEVIVKHTGDLFVILSDYPDIVVTPLLNGYGILRIPEFLVDTIASLEQITYMEKPKRLYFEVLQGRRASCITSLQNTNPSTFTGRGTLVAVIDSGIDYAHPDFQTPTGQTRILDLWDQTLAPNPSQNRNSPEGYPLGTLFSESQINEALAAPTILDQERICPSFDRSGHGTHVAGIAAGNGRASNGQYRGVAYEASLIIVKLGTPNPLGFPSTTQLMQAIDFCIKRSLFYQMPLALNLSFGNTYGSHSGTSLIETYLDAVSDNGQCCIVVGSGNEGSGGGHTSGILSEGETQTVEFAVGDYSTAFSIQIWKKYWDLIRFAIRAPSATSSFIINPQSGIQRYRVDSTDLLIYFGEPSPYSVYQEIYLDFIPAENYVDTGIWTITLEALSIRDGEWDMWMPVFSTRNDATRFLRPTPDITLTIPSTASKVITVGAYDSTNDSLAPFSGRGYTWATHLAKPDLVAPGVNINSCAPGGGYTIRSGTSMATPFVTGSCSILMQWGIVDNNDRYLYGEKMKAYLRKGARPLPGFLEYPNPQVGWGALCVEDSLPT